MNPWIANNCPFLTTVSASLTPYLKKQGFELYTKTWSFNPNPLNSAINPP